MSESTISSEWDLYVPVVRDDTSLISWDDCRDEAIFHLDQHACAPELVYRLQEFRHLLSSAQDNAFDKFMMGLNKVAKGESTRLVKEKQIGGLLEELNESINNTDDSEDSDREEQAGSGSPVEAFSASDLSAGSGAPSNTVRPTSISGSSGGTDESTSEGDDNPSNNIRAISPKEDKAFAELFAIVQATPRKIKRVVNLYVLNLVR